MTKKQMKARTKQLALRVFKLCHALPWETEAQVVRQQLARCGSSVGVNYRASLRARSDAEFRSKLGNVEEEADETCYWLELIIENGMLPARRVEPLWREAEEIVKIIAASLRTSKQRSAPIRNPK